jgi:hypothetical protein
VIEQALNGLYLGVGFAVGSAAVGVFGRCVSSLRAWCRAPYQHPPTDRPWRFSERCQVTERPRIMCHCAMCNVPRAHA